MCPNIHSVPSCQARNITEEQILYTFYISLSPIRVSNNPGSPITFQIRRNFHRWENIVHYRSYPAVRPTLITLFPITIHDHRAHMDLNSTHRHYSLHIRPIKIIIEINIPGHQRTTTEPNHHPLPEFHCGKPSYPQLLFPSCCIPHSNSHWTICWWWHSVQIQALHRLSLQVRAAAIK